MAPDDILKYASFSKNEPTTLGTYFPQDGLIVFDEIGRITEVLESLEVEEEAMVCITSRRRENRPFSKTIFYI